MKNLIISSFLVGLAVIAASAQVDNQELLKDEAWRFAQAYDRSIIDNDVAFLERHLAASFFSIGPNSYKMDRQKAIEEAKVRKKDSRAPDYTVSALESIPVDIRVSGNLVIITSNWRVTRTSNTALNAAPQVHTGTTTAVYRKTDKWEILSEHVSFDRPQTKDIVKPIGAASRRYMELLINNNVADISELLTENYVRSVPSEPVRDKANFLKDLREAKLTFKDIQSAGFYVNVAGDNAIENGELVVDGGRPGEPSFLEAYEYVRTWVKRNDQWKIATESYTLVKKAP